MEKRTESDHKLLKGEKGDGVEVGVGRGPVKHNTQRGTERTRRGPPVAEHRSRVVDNTTSALRHALCKAEKEQIIFQRLQKTK